MTGATGHLVSHSGYGSLIVPGVLLKAEGKTPASWERKSSAGVHREAKNRPRAKDAPPPLPHLSGSARAPLAPENRWPGPHLYLSVPPLPGSCGRTASAATPLSPGTAQSWLREKEPQRHPIPKKESKKAVPPGGGTSGTLRSEGRHATPVPHLPDNPCTETPHLSGDQTSGSLKHPERLRTRKKKQRLWLRASSP